MLGHCKKEKQKSFLFLEKNEKNTIDIFDIVSK